MQKKTTKYMLAGIVAVIASVLTLTSVQSASTLQFDNVTTGEIGYVAGPDAYLASGGRSALIVSVPSDIIEAKRGQNIDVPITITHKAGKNPLDAYVVRFEGVSNSLILPSAVSKQTPEERSQAIRDNKPVEGMVDLAPFITYSPGRISIAVGETKTITAHIHVPELPDEMVGKHVRFVPNVADENANSGIFPSMIMVKVVG